MKNIKRLTISAGIGLSLLTFVVSTVGAAAPMSYSMSKLMWNTAPGVKSYNIYYKEVGNKKWTHAVRNLPANSNSYTVMYLKPGVTYKYNISAVNPAGKEYWWSGEKNLMVTAQK